MCTCVHFSVQGPCRVSGVYSPVSLREIPNFCVVLCIVCFVSFSVFFVCKCVLYYCHRVATQLQLNISYHKPRIRFQVSSREICGGPSFTEKDFSPSTLLFPLSASSHQYAILIFIYMLLLRGQMDKTWEHSKKNCSFVNLGALERTVLYMSTH